MKKIIISALVLSIFTTTNTYAAAPVVTCVNCSDKFTQALERITSLNELAQLKQVYDETIMQTMQQIEMVRQNIEQYSNMIKNTIQLPQKLINAVAGELGKLAQITNALNSLRHDVEGMGQIFDNLYLNTDAFQDLANAPISEMPNVGETIRTNVLGMAKEVDRAVKATFQLTGQQLKDLEMSGELESYMNELLSTPEGQQQALMAGNQLAVLQVQEARQLRELMATKFQSDLASQVKNEKLEQLSEEFAHEIFQMDLDTTPHDDVIF